MEAPPGRGTLKAMGDVVVEYMKDRYVVDDVDKVRPITCKKCDIPIAFVTMYVSIHYDEFQGCAGGGECMQLPLPYCPICEGMPKNRATCVHVPSGAILRERAQGLVKKKPHEET